MFLVDIVSACAGCGAAMTAMTCAGCGAAMTAMTCAGCGAAMTAMTCAGCGAAMTARTRFWCVGLKECGSRLCGKRFLLKLKWTVCDRYVMPVILYKSEVCSMREREMIILRIEKPMVGAFCGA